MKGSTNNRKMAPVLLAVLLAAGLVGAAVLCSVPASGFCVASMCAVLLVWAGLLFTPAVSPAVLPIPPRQAPGILFIPVKPPRS